MTSILVVVGFLGFAAPVVERGDTTCALLPNTMSCSFALDGTTIQLGAGCETSYPGPNMCYFGIGSQRPTPVPLPTWKPKLKTGVFMKTQSCGGGCNPVANGGTMWSIPVFDHAAGWTVKGATGDWILEFDSVRFRSTSPYVVLDSATSTWKTVPATAELVIRPRWTRVHEGRAWVKWTDSVEVPGARSSSTPILDSTTRVRRPLLRWVGTAPGRLDSLRCQVRDTAHKPWIWGGNGFGQPHPAFQMVDRDSVQGRVGGHLSPGSQTLQPLRFRSMVPSTPVQIPVGSIWDLDASIEWDGGDSSKQVAASPLPEPGDSSAVGWRRLSATWSWKIEGIRDSVVVSGWVPTRFTVSMPARVTIPRQPGQGSVDAAGRILTETEKQFNLLRGRVPISR